MYKILLDDFIDDNHIILIYIMIAICVCILLTYTFLLSIGIIKGMVLSSKCNVELIEYESIRYQIYKIFEYFDKYTIVALLLLFIGFIIFIVLINIIEPRNGSIKSIKLLFIITFYIAMFQNYNSSLLEEKNKIMNYIGISIVYIILFMSSIMVNNKEISSKVLILIFTGLLYFNYTIYSLYLKIDKIDDKNAPSSFTPEFLKAIAVNICIILILIKVQTDSDEATIKKYVLGITVISICSILFINLLYVINILGHNFRVEYETLIENLNSAFTKIIQQKIDKDTLEYFLFKENNDEDFMNNVCDYYVLLTHPLQEQLADYDTSGTFPKSEDQNPLNKNTYISELKKNNSSINEIPKVIVKKFEINYKEELESIILSLNGNCDQLLPNKSNRTNRDTLKKIKLSQEDKINIRILFKKFANSFIQSDESFKSMQKLILNNYNALHEEKTTSLILDDIDDNGLKIPDVADNFAVLYIPLFDDNPDKFVKNLKKYGIINDSNEEQIEENLIDFTLNINEMINNERENLDLNLIKMVTFMIGSIIVFIICLVIYIAYMNAYPIGIIITIGSIIFSIMILTIVRVISEGIH